MATRNYSLEAAQITPRPRTLPDSIFQGAEHVNMSLGVVNIILVVTIYESSLWENND